ncbi:hypothetical protein HELRODRAFT_190389, partial [Helobdella robusta]|uniref:Uncharacterized protein n=1 Tax=Helobdella robusta TaxID=6412 RepID=T1FRY5_HELRO
MTLSQLRDAEHNHTINQLTAEIKRLKMENTRLNSDLIKMGIHRPASANDILNDNSEKVDHFCENWPSAGVATSNTTRRSYDALSTANNNQHNENEPSIACQTSKPTDQKVFLNGRIIMSHSTNLQQIFRNHAEFAFANGLENKEANSVTVKVGTGELHDKDLPKEKNREPQTKQHTTQNHQLNLENQLQKFSHLFNSKAQHVVETILN